MSVVSIATLKTYFNTGDFPTEQNFIDLIDTLGVGTTFESKTFKLSADGTSITGSDAGITLETSGASAKIRVPTASTMKLALFNVRADVNGTATSGMSNGTVQGAAGSTTTGSVINCISNIVTGNGWSGLITAITSTYFEITFTQTGTGLAITGQMHLHE